MRIPISKNPAMPDTAKRYDGSLIGLATGDALGASVEFSAPNSFQRIKEMVGGGVFGLKPGQWTDDTSMALCLADSLISRNGFDPVDQLDRYVRWHKDGYLSCNGVCFDIGMTTKNALDNFEKTREPFCGPTDRFSAGNGSLMRLAPVALFYSAKPEMAIFFSGQSSKTTHQAQIAVDACMYLGGLIVGAINNVNKEKLLSPLYSPVPDYGKLNPLCDEILDVAQGSFKIKNPPEIKGTGYAAKSLEAALWSFYNSSSFEDGLVEAVNLGDDADTTGAIFGQLAGAYYGLGGIPDRWTTMLAMRETILTFAEKLYHLARLQMLMKTL